eukprot:1158225-Pelagomonas_calceolata.AAC.8
MALNVGPACTIVRCTLGNRPDDQRLHVLPAREPSCFWLVHGIMHVRHPDQERVLPGGHQQPPQLWRGRLAFVWTDVINLESQSRQAGLQLFWMGGLVFLMSSTVPNIFPNEERQALMETCRQQSQKKGLKLETAEDALVAAAQKLHSSITWPLAIQSGLRMRLWLRHKNYIPLSLGLWQYRFPEWPEDALVAVAQKQLDSLPDVSNEERSSIVTICRTFHMDVRHLSKQYRCAERAVGERLHGADGTCKQQLLNSVQK